MKKVIFLFIVSIFSSSFIIDYNYAAVGNTAVAKWKDNKAGAYSLRFDDSMMSHHDHTIPNLIKRGLVGSFFINPGLNRYGYGINTWESLVSRTGIELCPHSMNHYGAADFEEADYEIGDAFRTVWKLNPPDKSKMYPFSRGGGTIWPSGYLEAIQNKYPSFDYGKEALRYNRTDDANELIAFAKNAMDNSAWHTLLTHGTGPNLEWLGLEVSNFEALLDYLASVKDKLWVGNIGDIYKYTIERKSAKVTVLESNDKVIRLNLTSEFDPELYDYPLTLITDVIPEWKNCHISQGKLQTIHPVNKGRVLYEAIPNRGDILLKNSSMDYSPPSGMIVRDGTGEDIDASPYTTKISANWNEAKDEESGISRCWYKIGTTAGGSEVLDWIDNGLERSFTTSRTNFSLIRGEKYYITVKTVNGVGLSTESCSNGFTVNTTPNCISFIENFDNGYLSQWEEKHTKTGFQTNEIYISDQAAHTGRYGILCDIKEKQTNTPYIAKHNITEFEDVFTRLYFKLSQDFTIPVDNGSIQILKLTDFNGRFIAGVYIGYSKSYGLHIYALCQDNSGSTDALPGGGYAYPLRFIKIEIDKWHKIDIRTIAHNGKGGAEIWINGIRKGCIVNRFTSNMVIKNLYIGALNISDKNISGKIFFDDIVVSDSYLK